MSTSLRDFYPSKYVDREEAWVHLCNQGHTKRMANLGEQ